MSSILLSSEMLGGAELPFWTEVSKALREKGCHLVVAMPGTTMDGGELAILPEAGRFAPLCRHSVLTEEDYDEGLEWAAKWKSGDTRDSLLIRMRGFEAQVAIVRPDLILLWNGLRPVNLLLWKLASRMGIPTLVVERTPWPMTLSLDAEGSLLNTNAYGASRIESPIIVGNDDHAPVGKQYFDNIRKSASTWWEQPPDQDLEGLRKHLGIRIGQKVLLFAGQVDTDVQQFRYSPYFGSNIEAFRAFCEVVPDSEDLFILGKHHPKSSTPPEEFDKIVGGRGRWVTDVGLGDAFALADRVAAVNSAVVFESMDIGLPSMAMGETMLKDHSILLEWKNARDVETTEKWINMKEAEFAVRRERFYQITGYHLKRNFYELSGTGDRGSEKFAEDCITKLVNGRIKWSNLNIDIADLATLVDEGFAIRRSRLASGILQMGRKMGGIRSRLEQFVKS